MTAQRNDPPPRNEGPPNQNDHGQNSGASVINSTPESRLEYRVRSARRAFDLGYHFEAGWMRWDAAKGRKTIDGLPKDWQQQPQRAWELIEADLRSGRCNALIGHGSSSRPDLGGLTFHDGDGDIATPEQAAKLADGAGLAGTRDLDRIAQALRTQPFGQSGNGGYHWASRGHVVSSTWLKTKDTLFLPGSEHVGPDGQVRVYVGELPDPVSLPEVPPALLVRYRASGQRSAVAYVADGGFWSERPPMSAGRARDVADEKVRGIVARFGYGKWRPKAGFRDAMVTDVAFFIGSLVGSPHLPDVTYDRAWSVLEQAALTVFPGNLNDDDLKWIAQGLDDGVRKPLRIAPDAIGGLPADPSSAAPGEQVPGAAPSDVFEQAVSTELGRLIVREEARKRLADRNAPPRMPVGELAVSLADLLSEEDTEPDFRIKGLWPSGGNVLLSAQRKAGKSTMVGNLVRCLVDGDSFLADQAPWIAGSEPPAHEVTPLPAGGKVVLFDSELTRKMVRAWLRDQSIRKVDDVVIVPLKGRLGQFRITDDGDRARWAGWLRSIGASVLIVDVAAPLLNDSGLSETDNHDVQTWIAAFDALKAESGATEGMVVHHTGHDQERARGASRWEGWADAFWMLVYGGRQGEQPRPDAKRFFRAQGRDVAVPEAELGYTPGTRRLWLSGGGSREEQRADLADAKARVLAFVKASPGANTRALKALCHGDDGARAAAVLASSGQLAVVEGLKQGQHRTKHHFEPGTEALQQMRSLMEGNDTVTGKDIEALLEPFQNGVGPGGSKVGPDPRGEWVGPVPVGGPTTTTTHHKEETIIGTHPPENDTSTFWPQS